jgi:hypothetical protein
MGSQQLNNISESCPFVSDNMVPEWAQMFADSLKPLIQNLQHSQGQQLKQSVLFDTPMIKFNMVGSSIQSYSVSCKTNRTDSQAQKYYGKDHCKSNSGETSKREHDKQDQ